jgi:hypothetical protein
MQTSSSCEKKEDFHLDTVKPFTQSTRKKKLKKKKKKMMMMGKRDDAPNVNLKFLYISVRNELVGKKERTESASTRFNDSKKIPRKAKVDEQSDVYHISPSLLLRHVGYPVRWQVFSDLTLHVLDSWLAWTKSGASVSWWSLGELDAWGAGERSLSLVKGKVKSEV